MKKTHFTNLGAFGAGAPANGAGYIKYRQGVVDRLRAGEDVPAAWKGERFLARALDRLDAWRRAENA